MNLEDLKNDGQAPVWMDEFGLKTLQGGYLLPDETPLKMYQRVSKAAGSYYADQKWTTKFFDVMWAGWLCPASPVLSNLGTKRGLPISCNSIHVGDSVDSIFTKAHELAMLSKNGAGVGIYVGDVRGRGATIQGNGRSEGIIPWNKVFESTVISVSQGSTRRGAAAVYLPMEHADIEEFIQMRKPTGDINRRCMNLNHGVCITDEWMREMLAGDQSKRGLWRMILESRVTTGEPYLFFSDNVNKVNPACYTDKGLSVKTSNICTEIFLHTDKDHSFVCCLSSLNLAKWDEWKDTDLPLIAVRFLDAVLSEYIEKGRGVSGLEASVRSAEKGRAIGIGVLGWHTYLQQNMLPFDSFEAMMANAQIFKTIRNGAEKESAVLAQELGEPLWCKGHGRRNTHLLAVAPTVSNSTIAGGYSAGIEPLAANIFSQKSAKGTFIRKNAVLQRHLVTLGMDTPEIWKSINENSGSIQHLSRLDDKTKDVFKTAREINQYAIVKQAAQRQKYIDQGQSVNLFFGANADPKYIHGVHLEAWRTGLKSLYYFRSEGMIRGDFASRSKDECAACEG